MALQGGRLRKRSGFWILGILLLIAAALALNMVLVDRETRTAAPRGGGSIVKNKVANANVKVESNGPPIVLLHGFSAALDWWDDIAPGLATEHKLIRIDLIGHGGTDAPAIPTHYTMENQAEMVAAVMAALGVGKAAVIAHSMGGEVASTLLMSHPELVDRVVLIDTPSEPSVTFNPLTDAYLEPVIGEVLNRLRTDDAIREGLAQGFAPGFEVPDRFVADVWQLTYTAFKSATDESHAFQNREPLYQRLKALKSLPPFLVIFGAKDALVPVATARKFEQVPGIKLEFVDGAGHSPMVEQS
jgi:pimeloyl-ACP methyl ester carboxylesterase